MTIMIMSTVLDRHQRHARLHVERTLHLRFEEISFDELAQIVQPQQLRSGALVCLTCFLTEVRRRDCAERIFQPLLSCVCHHLDSRLVHSRVALECFRVKHPLVRVLVVRDVQDCVIEGFDRRVRAMLPCSAIYRNDFSHRAVGLHFVAHYVPQRQTRLVEARIVEQCYLRLRTRAVLFVVNREPPLLSCLVQRVMVENASNVDGLHVQIRIIQAMLVEDFALISVLTIDDKGNVDHDAARRNAPSRHKAHPM